MDTLDTTFRTELLRDVLALRRAIAAAVGDTAPIFPIDCARYANWLMDEATLDDLKGESVALSALMRRLKKAGIP